MLTDLLQAFRDSTTAGQDFIDWMTDIANSGSCLISTTACAVPKLAHNR